MKYVICHKDQYDMPRAYATGDSLKETLLRLKEELIEYRNVHPNTLFYKRPSILMGPKGLKRSNA